MVEARREQHAIAGLAEFHRVGDEVQQHLLQLQRIGACSRGSIGAEIDIDADLQRAGALADELHHVADDHRNLGLFLVELDLAGFELRDVENVADDAEKMLRARADVARIADITLAAERPHDLVGHHLAEADDGVERRAQLMAHIGEEFGLAAARQLGLFLGVEQRRARRLCGR